MKKLFAIGLMLMLALALIAGCSQQQEEPAQDTNVQEPAEQAPVTPETTAVVDTTGAAVDTTMQDTTTGM